ncbi:phosphoenolpyruvate synthase [Pontibacter cellulosilyticus]|uniref:Phosphoenolpyruvate synthase n=1 Tax=Pontibacter cellulosilyticus TaxID=1720253 RepID=A0A923SHP0_9BACT|nr:phosphoenolpyruvate synthase [Pontibacter cellulosilyticus]MBC5991898.1 phosphoenolpyruvate synthase [Pontibacter cellulosilyticus]
MAPFIKLFKDISYQDLSKVGGKNASLGEMYNQLNPEGIKVPDGYATTSDAYWHFLEHNNLKEQLKTILGRLDTEQFKNLSEVGKQARELILSVDFPEEIRQQIEEGYTYLQSEYGDKISLAVRSSATAEDLPTASFAGQLETYLNVSGLNNLYKACHHSYASLFTDRAIKYRVDNNFEHMQVALSVGVQVMVRSDKACSGVMFTLDPDTGFEKVIVISGSWGLGENIVQGAVNTDEFVVFEPMLGNAKQPIISRKLGSKAKTMVYAEKQEGELQNPTDAILNIDTPPEKQEVFVLQDEEVVQLAKWGKRIEEHYKQAMDIEWAKDGESGELFIVQARPETVQSQHKDQAFFTEYTLKDEGTILTSGIGLSNRIVSGVARILHSPKEIDKLQEGEVLVTRKTDPDWDPILKKAVAIVTEQGGRTSHAAIVAREVGAVAVLGTNDATKKIQDGQQVTVSTAGGETGYVYEGELEWEETKTDMSKLEKPDTKAMLILGDPEQAFKYSFLPNDGVGLMRMEFIINNAIQIHPMALKRFEKVEDQEAREKIEQLTHHYANKENYFVDKLAEATAVVAAAFYPKDVIVRMSDFKSNEYANLIGGRKFEPEESNPMIGLRGASRYYHPLYQEGFELECRAMKKVRDEIGLTNIKLMIPFCRTVDEGKKVIDLMANYGLKRGDNGLEVYVMVEIPSNALLAEQFAEIFDGFSIGSNDLTQLTLGADRDSGLLSDIFSPFDEAVQQLIVMTLEKAKKTGTKVGLCGQAPSDYPEYAAFLVEHGIDSISFNPDAFFRGLNNMLQAEKERNTAPSKV